MDKSELLQRIQEAAALYRDGRHYEAFQLIEPVHQRVRHEKVVKLYTATRRKVLHALQQLTDENRPGRIVELHHQFLHDIEDPEILVFVEEAEKAVARKPKPEPLEISFEDIDPALEDPETEIISDSWIRGIASDETASDIAAEAGEEPSEQPEAPVTTEADRDDEHASEEAGDIDINELIQRGVSLYEVGDVLNAVKTWEHGLSLAPDNVILKEYIANARRELDAELEETAPDESEPAVAPAAPPPRVGPAEPLNRDELNQIIATGRAGEVEQALRDLEALAVRCGPAPQIDEARTYLQSLAQEYGVSTAVARARQLMEEKKIREAVHLLEDQTNRYPDNDQLRTALEHARKKMMEEPPPEVALELDFDAKGEAPTVEPPKPTVPVERPKSKARRSKPIVMARSGNAWKIGLIAAAVIIVAAVVVWVVVPKLQLKRFTDQLQQTTAKEKIPKTPTAAEREAAQAREREATIQQARDMFNQRRYLFAYYLFLHADSISPLTEDERQFLTAAQSEMSVQINEKRLQRRADQAFRKKDYSAASDLYYRLLSANPNNIAYKKRLFQCYEQEGVHRAFQGMAEQARESFTFARILEPGNKTIQKHQQVIARYISGLISRKQVREWFFFFQ